MIKGNRAEENRVKKPALITAETDREIILKVGSYGAGCCVNDSA